MAQDTITTLVRWFIKQSGTFDTSSMAIVELPESGRGAIALKDMPADYTIFSLPRELTLSTRTSDLPTLMDKSWKEHRLHEGWVGLILCMMWEEFRGPESRWSGYLAALPDKFDTPMFWSEDELRELQGTAVIDKVGRMDAERDYHEKLVPAVKSRTDIFPRDKYDKYFSLDRYHLNGSRILSRSFHVEQWKGQHNENLGSEGDEDGSGDGMDIDFQVPSNATNSGNQPGAAAEEIQEMPIEDDEEFGDEEDPADVAMVPMADMLNARHESENAKLFYEEHELRMVTTKPIKAGEQIWNTYGDPPNSDLLRRYGHVDVVPLRPPLYGLGNPEDVVEIRADLVVASASKQVSHGLQERVNWWLEEADDDVFILRTDCELPEEFISFGRLLLLSEVEWTKTAKKGKLPKSKVDTAVLTLALDVLSTRMKEYLTTIDEDEELLSASDIASLSVHRKHAIIVRLGEKRIIQATMKQLHTQVALSGSTKKRSREEEKGRDSKKAKK